MPNVASLRLFSALRLVIVSSASMFLTACGTVRQSVQVDVLKGHVTAAQAPVAEAALQLYAASSSGYAAEAAPLIQSVITTDKDGGFSIPLAGVCPSPGALVYLVASNAGTLTFLSALGLCGDLTASTPITINEFTTIASVFALKPFMSGAARVGTTPQNSLGLAHAFASIRKLVHLDTGQAPGTMPAGSVAPTAALNTLADLVALCAAPARSALRCNAFLQAAGKAGQPAPGNTLEAALAIAKDPGHNVSELLALVGTSAPFQPTLKDASDFTLSLHYKPALHAPSAAAIDARGNLWITNAGDDSVSVIDPSGSSVVGSPFTTGGLSQPSAIAIDPAGNAWVLNKKSSSLSVFSPDGAGTLTAAAGLSAPASVAIDSSGLLWIANSGNASVTAISFAGTTYLSSASYAVAGGRNPSFIAVDSSLAAGAVHARR